MEEIRCDCAAGSFGKIFAGDGLCRDGTSRVGKAGTGIAGEGQYEAGTVSLLAGEIGLPGTALRCSDCVFPEGDFARSGNGTRVRQSRALLLLSKPEYEGAGELRKGD